MERDTRDQIIERVFKASCGPQVEYVSHEVSTKRTLMIEYKIPSVSDAMIFKIYDVPLRTGLNSNMWAIARRIGASAKAHAYRISGKRRQDMKQLLKGKLIDERPRRDAKAKEVGPATAVDPEPGSGDDGV